MSDPVSEFLALTGAQPSEAQVYLEMAEGDSEVAAALYLSSQPSKPSSGAAAAGATVASNRPTSTYADSQPSAPSSSSTAKPFPTMNTSRARGQITTFASLNKEGSAADDDDDDGDNPEEYYTGGEKSGLAVQNPNSSKNKKKKLADELLEMAQKHGAESKDDYERSMKQPFQGTAHRLGQVQSIKTQGSMQDQVFRVQIKFFEDGFVVLPPDAEEWDCPLRAYEAPDSKVFLEALNAQRVPPELMKLSKGKQVHVDLLKVDSKYTAPKKEFRAFKGTGHSLAPPAESQLSHSSQSQQSSSASGGVAGLASAISGSIGSLFKSGTGVSAASPAAAPPTPKFELVPGKPTVKVAVRTKDGSRLVGEFHADHTVGHIRSWLASQNRPVDALSVGGRPGAPARDLADADLVDSFKGEMLVQK
eukprot:ANDGO_03630.mRNA.1 Plant UBX domain-containing protein 5